MTGMGICMNLIEKGVRRVSGTGTTLIADGGEGDTQNFIFVERGHIIKGTLPVKDWKKFQLYDDYIGMQTRISQQILERQQ